MALVVKDRVQETTTTTGTGTVTLAGAVTGFQTFAAIGDGNTCYYAITSGSDWEVGLGTYTSSGTTLSRDTILESSNAGSAITLSGTSNVFVTYPAEKSVNTDDIGTTIQAYDANTAKFSNLGVRNLIINGDMRIAQRGTSVASISTEGYKTVDRMKTALNRDQLVLTNEQSSDAPANFDYSYKYTVTTAETTVDAGNFLQLEHFIEGLNTGHLAWGSSDAKTITLSFWAKSSSTGVFPITLSNSAGDWHYPTSYTISSANTWEQKSITITGATSGTWLNTNGIGIGLRFGIAYGSTYNGATANAWLNSAGFANAFVTQTNTVMTTSSATWQITAIQLEVGDTATPFEHRPYDMELTRCQRYFEKSYNYGTSLGSATGEGICSYIVMAQSTTSLANNGISGVLFKVTKRANPTVTVYDFAGNSGKLSYSRNGSPRADNITAVVHRQSENACGVYTTSASGMTAGYAVEQHHHWTADSEL